MAEAGKRLAAIFGTGIFGEGMFGTGKERVNCPFYFRIGACRHGDRCSRLHSRPSISPTILLSNMYQRPDMIATGATMDPSAQDPRHIQRHFDDFYEDLFDELSKYGEIESLNVCDNLTDHMVGNVYVRFREEEHAANALKNLTGRFYAGRPIIVDFSPVTDFREAICKQYEEKNMCSRGRYCNFVHLKKTSRMEISNNHNEEDMDHMNMMANLVGDSSIENEGLDFTIVHIAGFQF